MITSRDAMDYKHICIRRIFEPLCFWKSKEDFVHPLVKVCILLSWMDITLTNLVAKKELQGHLYA
jgi:hypothetical protein